MNKEFTSQLLNEHGMANAKKIAEAFDTLMVTLTEEHIEGDNPATVPICPPSRETSIMRTKLEEACFFAKKAMANAPGNTG